MAPFSTTPPSSSSSSNNNGAATVYRRKMNSSLSSSSCNNWRSDTADLPMYYNNNNHSNHNRDKNGNRSSSPSSLSSSKTRSIVGVITFTFCIAIIVVLGINKEIDIKIAAIMDPPPPRLQLYEQQNNRQRRVDQQQKKEDVENEQQQKQHQKHRQRRDEQQQKKEDVEKEQQKNHVIEAEENENENENNVPSTTIRQDLQPIMVDHTTVKKMDNVEEKIVLADAKQQLSSSSSTPDNSIIYYDIVIAGAGPSGLTAALFASRAGLNVYVLGSSATGLLSQTKHLDNFPSFTGNSGVSSGSDTSSDKSAGSGTGPGWLKATYKQAKFWGTKFGPSGLLISSIERRLQQEEAEGKKNNDYYFALKTDGSSSENDNDNTIRSYSVIVASGANPRKLNLPGEDKLWGVSLHNCAICDGHIYQAGGGFDDEEPIETTVLVVGGGDAALDAALLLSRYATKVILVHRRNEFTKAHNINSLNLIKSSSKIEIMTPYTVNEWITQKDDPSQLTGVKLLHNKEKEKEEIVLKIDGAFVMIGATPNTDWINTKQTSTTNNYNLGLDLDDEGLIKTSIQLSQGMGADGITSTNIPGLFAAGEVTDNIYKQAITAASAGAQAAIDAERWLREHRPPSSQSKSQLQPKQQQQQQQRITTKTKSYTADADAEVVAAASIVVDEKKKDDIKINIKKNDENDDDDNCDLTLQDCINTIIHKYPVVVFSKPSCPYCHKALEALSLAGIPQDGEKSEHNDAMLHVIDLSQHSNTQEIQKTLKTMTGRRTVPNVFVGGTSIGGGDETSKFQKNGQLVPLLEKAGAFIKKNIENDNDTDTSSSLMKNKSSSSSDIIIKDGIEKVEEKTNTSIDRKTVDKVAHATNDFGGESCDLAYEECFLEIIDKYSVVMFSLSWCPECKRMLELLNRIGVDTTNNQVHIIDLDDFKPIAATIRQHMKKLTERRSVPNLFIDSEFIGGFSQTNEMHEQGQLIPKFINAEIITPTLFGLTHIHHSRSEPHRHKHITR